MSVSFYMDENVEGAIIAALLDRGVDVLSAREDGHDNTPDDLVFDRANSLGRVLVSEDADMLAEGTKRLRSGGTFAGLIFWHQQRLSWGVVISNLELLGVAGLAEDVQDQILFLPL